MSDFDPTDSEQAVTAPTEPPTPPDINPEVPQQSPDADAFSGAQEPPEVPSLEARVHALESRVFGYPLYPPPD